jgi:hypothetical protein
LATTKPGAQTSLPDRLTFDAFLRENFELRCLRRATPTQV